MICQIALPQTAGQRHFKGFKAGPNDAVGGYIGAGVTLAIKSLCGAFFRKRPVLSYPSYSRPFVPFVLPYFPYPSSPHPAQSCERLWAGFCLGGWRQRWRPRLMGQFSARRISSWTRTLTSVDVARNCCKCSASIWIEEGRLLESGR